MTAHITIRIPGIAHPICIDVSADGRERIVRAAQDAGCGRISQWLLARLDEARGDLSYDAAAARAGLSLSSWIRIVAYEAARVSALSEQLDRVRVTW